MGRSKCSRGCIGGLGKRVCNQNTLPTTARLNATEIKRRIVNKRLLIIHLHQAVFTKTELDALSPGALAEVTTFLISPDAGQGSDV